EAQRAHDLLPAWAETDRQLAQVWTLAAKTRQQPALLAVARRWRRQAADRDPSDPALWSELADTELDAELLDAALGHYRRALADDPWSVHALNGVARLAIAEGPVP